MTLLDFARGPALQWSLFILVAGIVWRVIDRDGSTILESATATVAGSVFDSTRTTPVPGVVLRAATGEEVTTSQAGSFLLTGLADGLQTLEVTVHRGERRLGMMLDDDNVVLEIKPNSRLGCQVKVGDADLVVELTQETVEVWFNEHPEHRPK